MKIKVKNINAYTKEVSFDIPWVTLEPDFNKAVKSFSKKVKLPGFRPGKIPKDRLMQQFKPNIEAQFMDDNIHKYYLTALQEEKIVPVNQAEISNVSFKMDENFSFTAKFEVEPDFNLPKFKNNMFKVQKNKFIPDDKDTEDAITQLRRSHARIETVEDGAKEKDFILCDGPDDLCHLRCCDARASDAAEVCGLATGTARHLYGVFERHQAGQHQKASGLFLHCSGRLHGAWIFIQQLKWLNGWHTPSLQSRIDEGRSVLGCGLCGLPLGEFGYRRF